MQIQPLAIPDILLIIPIKRHDERGFFSETSRRDVLAAAGVTEEFIQDNHVYSAKRGVLRGLHFQTPPHAQGKLVRCTRGAILDIAVDIRKGSPTYGQHAAAELSAENWHQLWIPAGFAHGYVTLESHSEVIYKVTDYWHPACERGIAWNDPELAIEWGISTADAIVANKDRTNPRLSELESFFDFVPRTLGP
ncbi:MAG TPA: dTDP-4-dehydrorhamnose 3,5-epimerase [Pseudolabrys sp.]|nr:dTDP-4-dehydrorhamnose 3,5-epimerase [Pseudolabrys sp.]